MMKKRGKRPRLPKVLLCLFTAALLLAGCGFLKEETIKLRDLEFTVLSEEKIPAELLTIIEEKKADPFQITYSDNQYLYICVGYGEHRRSRTKRLPIPT